MMDPYKSSEIIEKIKKEISSAEDVLGECEAIGICGSLVRGTFNERSDIDIFIILKKYEKSAVETYLYWHFKVRELLEDLRRDLTVIVYPIKAIEEINNWYVLRLASEGIFIYDKGGVAQLFKRVVESALKQGLVEEEIDGRKYWKFKDLKVGEHWEIKLI